MKINIRSIGTSKDKNIAQIENEYINRISWKIQLFQYQTNPKLQIPVKKNLEAEILLSKSNPNSFKIILDEHGKMLSSIEFSNLIEKIIQDSKKEIDFLIGGVHGHGEKLLSSPYLKLSLSELTFTYAFSRMILIEQIYRSFCTIAGKTYHIN